MPRSTRGTKALLVEGHRGVEATLGDGHQRSLVLPGEGGQGPQGVADVLGWLQDAGGSGGNRLLFGSKVWHEMPFQERDNEMPEMPGFKWKSFSELVPASGGPMRTCDHV